MILGREKDRGPINFGAAAGMNSLLLLLSNIIAISYIGPNGMGKINACLTFVPYLYFLQFGFINGFSRLYPFWLGAENKKAAKEAYQTGRYLVRVVTITAAICATLLSFTLLNQVTTQDIIIALSFVLLSALQFDNNFKLSTYRSAKNFQLLAKIYWLISLVALLSLPLVIYFGLEGNVLRLVIISGCQVILLNIFNFQNHKPRLHRKILIDILKSGPVIFATNYTLGLSKTFGRVLILVFGNEYLLGLFSPAIAVAATMTMIPNVILQYVYPKLNYLYGAGSHKKKVIQYSFRVTLVFILVLTPCLIIGTLTLPVFIHDFFPEYTDSIQATLITLFAGAISGIAQLYFGVLNVLGMFKRTIYLVALRCLYIFAGFLLLYNKCPLLTTAAGGLMVGELLFLLSLVALLIREMKQ